MPAGSGFRATSSAINKGARIPGVTGRKPPGNGNLGFRNFNTRVPFMSGSGGVTGASFFRESHRQIMRDRRGRFAGGWGFAWQGFEATHDEIHSLGLNLTSAGNLKGAVEQLAKDMLDYAQQNAPWQDRTGLARESLQSRVVWHDETSFSIFLGHGSEVYYGVWLEVRWGGRYAILLPTLLHFAPQFRSRIAGVV